jgi:hypothetical protein
MKSPSELFLSLFAAYRSLEARLASAERERLAAETRCVELIQQNRELRDEVSRNHAAQIELSTKVADFFCTKAFGRGVFEVLPLQPAPSVQPQDRVSLARRAVANAKKAAVEDIRRMVDAAAG